MWFSSKFPFLIRTRKEITQREVNDIILVRVGLRRNGNELASSLLGTKPCGQVQRGLRKDKLLPGLEEGS